MLVRPPGNDEHQHHEREVGRHHEAVAREPIIALVVTDLVALDRGRHAKHAAVVGEHRVVDRRLVAERRRLRCEILQPPLLSWRCLHLGFRLGGARHHILRYRLLRSHDTPTFKATTTDRPAAGEVIAPVIFF